MPYLVIEPNYFGTYSVVSYTGDQSTVIIPRMYNNLPVWYINNGAFENCTSLETINFTGTQTQWSTIKKSSGWNYRCPSDMKINFNYTEH